MATETTLWYQWLGEQDESAFAALVAPHLRFLFDYARRVGCSPSDADDVVQSALCELMRQRCDKPRRIGLRAWLGRSARSHASTLRRSDRRRKNHEKAAAQPESVEAHSLDAQDEVTRALARLDADARELVTLRFLHDLEYREIGLVVGRTENACRIRVHRALERLRRELGNGAPALLAALPLLASSAEAADSTIQRALDAPPMLPRAKWFGAAAAGSIASVVLVGAGLAVVSIVAVMRGGDLDDSRARLSHETRSGSARPALATADRPSGNVGERRDAVAPPAPPGDAEAGGGAQKKGARQSEQLCHFTGAIRFDDGQPLAAARLHVGPAKTTTDENGMFAVSYKPLRRTQILLIPEGGGNMRFAYFNHPGPGQTLKKEIVLERGRELTAQVVDEGSRSPIPHALVTLRAQERDQEPSTVQVFADADGKFRIPYVPNSEYVLGASHAGFLEQTIVIPADGGGDLGVIVLSPARTMSVRIDGAPAEAIGTEIRWMVRPGGRGSYLSGSAILGEDFSFTALEPNPNRRSAKLTIASHPVLPDLEHFFQVNPQQSGPTRVVVSYPPGAAVEGTLRDPDGEPLPDAALAIKAEWSNAEPGDWTFTRVRTWTTRTDSAGRFRFAKVRHGSAHVTLSSSGNRIHVGSVLVPKGGRVGVDARILGRCVVRGRVRTIPAGVSVKVEVFRQGNTHAIAMARTDREQGFEIDHLPEGEVQIRASNTLATGATATVELTVGQPLDIGDLKVKEYPRVPVRVIVPAGHAMPRVLNVWSSESRCWTIPIGSDGTCQLFSVPPGRHPVLVNAGQFARRKIWIRNDPGLPRQRIELRAAR